MKCDKTKFYLLKSKKKSRETKLFCENVMFIVFRNFKKKIINNWMRYNNKPVENTNCTL